MSALEPCGVAHFYNTGTGDRYLIFNFRTSLYSGQLLEESDEGKVFWADVDDLRTLRFASGLAERLPMFFEGRYSEIFALWNDEGRTETKRFELPEPKEA